MKGVAALLTAVCVSTLAAMGLAFAGGGLGPRIAAMSLAAGAAVGVAQFAAGLRRRGPADVPRRKIDAWEWFAIVVFALFSLRAFCWLIYFDGDDIKLLSPNNVGDISLHLTYINNLASGVPFWPENPIFAGGALHYPVGIDLFNSLLKLAGVDVYRGLVWVGLAGCVLSGVALFKWGRGFAIAGFLFNGGLAGFQFFTNFMPPAHWSAIFHSQYYQDLAANFHLDDYQSQLGWKSIPLAMFVTQRGLLYAFPAGLALLWSWRLRFFPDPEKKGEQPLPMWTEVLLYSTMPLFHVHTFLFLSFMLGCWLVVFIARAANGGDDFLIPWAKLVGSSVMPATLLIALIALGSSHVIHFVGTSDSSSWDWNYAEEPHYADAWTQAHHLSPLFAGAVNHLTMWVVNYGALPFFVATLTYALVIRRRTPAAFRAMVFVFPAVVLFLIALVVMFAKWDWDNTKIMAWCYIAVLPYLWEELLAQEELLLRAACCVMLFFSGFVTLLGGIDNSHMGDNDLTRFMTIAKRSELDEVADAVRPLPVTAIFAGDPTYNHPLLLNGRKMVEGYNGHLDSHGIDYTGNRDLLESLLNGEEDWRETARKLHARYLFWGRFEEGEFPDSNKPWETACLKVAEGDWGAIYDLETPAPQGQ
ncbi:MAG TPA: hypothetical protein VG733_01800 [Chthoniobacteraceae bacterium]|nr:hypothetical protein [Chthoniobacteraceae bacterium]